MQMITKKITSKGQVTIPRYIREKLGSDYIKFEIEGNQILIRPVVPARGSLSAYADPHKREHERDAWARAVAERKGTNLDSH